MGSSYASSSGYSTGSSYASFSGYSTGSSYPTSSGYSRKFRYPYTYDAEYLALNSEGKQPNQQQSALKPLISHVKKPKAEPKLPDIGEDPSFQETS